MTILPFGLSTHPGYIGMFTRERADGALANGTRVVKTAEDAEGDTTPLGTEGAVLGSLGHPELGGVAYFVEWDDKPGTALFCVAWKLTARQ